MARDKTVTGNNKSVNSGSAAKAVNGKENGQQGKKAGKSQQTAAKPVNGAPAKQPEEQKKKTEEVIVAAAATAEPAKVTEATETVVANGESTETTTTTSTTPNSEVVDEQSAEVMEIVQDIGFSVQILSPNSEPLTLQVSSLELVHEIHQLLMDREDSCHRTCFSLQMDGATLDNFAELKNIPGLQEGSVLRVNEEPYTMREARIHLRHIRDLLKSNEPTDAYNGLDCASLTFLFNITQGDLAEKKKARPDSVDCTPPEFIMPGTKDRPILPLHPLQAPKNSSAKEKPLAGVKVLTSSAWNPPPGPRKLHGDLMYLYVQTAEDKRYHISACQRGFYVNQSTDDVFNPKPATPSHLSHSLVDLLAQLSPTFKRVFPLMQKKRTQKHPFERIATPYQVFSWCAPPSEHTLDAIRAEETFTGKLGYEEHIPGQSRDWNEELQTTRELPRRNLAERLLRERAIFKVHSDFVAAATRGAMAVVDGNVMAINPGEDTRNQMFIWNNIFFSLGFDIRDHYKELGGDAAAFVAPRNDLHGVRVYSAVDVEGLFTLGTVVIDYRGYRVTAQTIIPGILEKEQEQSVVYGSTDFGKTVLTHEKYLELLNKASQHLRILPHKVLNENDEAVELSSSVECKGIIGNDGRHYILDLLKTFPPDVNFLRIDNDPDAEVSDELKAMNFPIRHKHKLSCLRQELLDAFYDDRYVMFIKSAALGLQQMNVNKYRQALAPKEGEGEEKDAEKEKAAEKLEGLLEAGGEAAKVLEKLDQQGEKKEGEEEATSTKESIINVSMDILSSVCTKVGSIKATEFDIRFNADVFSAGIRHVDNEGAPDSLSRQKQLIKDAAEFLVLKQIPAFVNDFADHASSPIDGVTFTQALHARGINVRYLGKVAQLLAQHENLEYLHTIAVMELILRATKHIYTTYMQNCETMSMAAAISHFLNCFLTSAQLANPQLNQDELQNLTQAQQKNRRSKKNKGKQQQEAKEGSANGGVSAAGSVSTGENNKQTEWAQLTQRSLWLQIKRELKQYWDWDLGCDNIESVCEKFQVQKVSLLRAFCVKVGLQISLREYSLEGRSGSSSTKVAFFEEDILNVFPVVKHINPRATDAYNFFTSGQQKIQQGLMKEGYDLIAESLNLLNNVYGALHPECVQCLRMLARLSYIMGDAQEAMNVQQRAVLMSERVHGVDHQCTITEYAHLALYCFANSQISTALKLLYRARYLTLVVFGENHPEMALLDSNISLILHAVGEYGLSLRFLEHALALNIKYYGDKSLKVAVTYHLVARTQSCMGDFRSALNHEKEAYGIYKQTLGFNHEKTQDSLECLRHLTQQAVVLQKKMNEYSNGKGVGQLPPIHIQPPSMGSVLEMLNVINGILFVQISPKDIANMKSEIEKRQKEEAEGAGEGSSAPALTENGEAPQTVPESVEVQS